MSGGDRASPVLWGLRAEGGTWGAGKEQSGLQAPAEASDKVWALGQARWIGGRCSKAHPELWEFNSLRSTGRFVHFIAVVSCSLRDAGVALHSVARGFVLEELLSPGKMPAGLLACAAVGALPPCASLPAPPSQANPKWRSGLAPVAEVSSHPEQKPRAPGYI